MTANSSIRTGLSLKDKVAIVTGAGSGIGEATAIKFAQLGAKLICAGLPGDPVADVVKTISRNDGEAVTFLGNLALPDVAQECVDFALQNFKKIDILVNNAGVALVDEPTENVSDEAFHRTIANNIFTVFYMTRAALPALQKSRGVVLASGSVAGIKGEPGDAIYGGTKGFIHSFMQGLATEQAHHGVRCNCVCPGAIDTAMTAPGKSPMTKSEEKEMVKGIPMQRKGTPEEIANVFAFLASDMASYVNGALWVVDGAYTVGNGEAQDVPSKLRKPPAGTLDNLLKHSTDGGFKKNNPVPPSHEVH